MSKEKLERNENEELKKSINSESEVSDLQESESSLQEEDSTEEITKEESEEKAEGAVEEKAEEATEETAEEVHEDELMEVPTSSGGKWLVAIFIAVIIGVIIGVVIVIMCRPKEKEPEPIAAVEQVQEEPKEEVEEVVEVVESEPVEEEVVTEEVEQPEKIEQETKQTLDNWLASLNLTEFKYCIWNEETSEGQLLEDNQTYKLENNDKIVLYKPEELGRMIFPEGVELNGMEKKEKYNILNLVFYGEVQFDAEVEKKDGTICPFNFTLVSNLEKEEIPKEEMTGEEWIKSLTTEHPEFVVWNDAKRTKKEIVDGEEYQFQEGDIVAVYYGQGYLLQGLKPYKCGLDYYNNFAILNYEQSQSNIEFEAQLANDDEETIIINFTLLP